MTRFAAAAGSAAELSRRCIRRGRANSVTPAEILLAGLAAWAWICRWKGCALLQIIYPPSPLRASRTRQRASRHRACCDIEVEACHLAETSSDVRPSRAMMDFALAIADVTCLSVPLRHSSKTGQDRKVGRIEHVGKSGTEVAERPRFSIAPLHAQACLRAPPLFPANCFCSGSSCRPGDTA